MPVTISDVARHAGVSIKTVSRVLNKEENVAEATRQKVLAAIEALGYVPNLWAQRLARGSSGLIALITESVESPYITEVIRGMMDAGDATDYSITIQRHNVDDPNDVALIVRMASQHRVDGMVFTPPCDRSQEIVEALQALEFPFVHLTPQERCGACAWVAATDEQGSYDAARHLIALGHTRIGIVQGPTNHRASWDRLNGYKRALTEAGLEIDASLIRPAGWAFDQGRVSAYDLLALNPRPTAIMAGNDETASGVIQAAWEQGLRCPEDLSVVGFDDVRLAAQLCPPLTTVCQPIYDIAATAVTILVNGLIPGRPVAHQVELPTHLVIRQSTGPCPIS